MVFPVNLIFSLHFLSPLCDVAPVNIEFSLLEFNVKVDYRASFPFFPAKLPLSEGIVQRKFENVGGE